MFNVRFVVRCSIFSTLLYIKCKLLTSHFISANLINYFFFHLQVDSDINDTDVHRSRSQLDTYEDFSSLRASDLKLRIEEMLRIKVP